jgi:cyclophilin family peptidyl-prolyl cis-trans isomerase/HEAT repeat protein
MQKRIRQSFNSNKPTCITLSAQVFSLIAVIASIPSCTEEPRVTNKFSDPHLVKIYDFKDRRLTDSLYKYFESNEEKYREEAALAFGSIQDSSSVDALGRLLRDQSPAVRAAAAFSIGQSGSSKSEALLIESLSTEKDKSVLDELIESYGKVTTKWDLSPMTIDRMPERFSWSLYRAGLRGQASHRLDSIAAILLRPPYKETTRLGAAHYFSRTAKNFEEFESTIIQSATTDSSAEIRISSALALGKIVTDSSLYAIGNIMKKERDYRVRVNAVRALRGFEFKKRQSILKAALSDPNINVAVASAEILASAIDKDSWKEFLLLCRSIENGRVKANLYEGVLAASENKEVAEEIVRKYRDATNPYDKAALLTALSHSVMSFGFVAEQLLNADVPIIRTSAAGTLVAINMRKNFDRALTEKFAAIYQQAIDTGDPAMIGIISTALADSALGYKKVLKDFTFLYEARKKLSLPKHIESIVPLDGAIAYFEGRSEVSSPAKLFNHPIDWKKVITIPKYQDVSISTTKGQVMLRLFVEEAPGSVLNFITLASSGYYDGKFFHRVVPNFVAQAGCDRGDGFGSEDYSIRSEFSRKRYKTGSLGMASAGKDTEGTQWFITHSPTPHLDGAYSIFGEVISGIEIVHSLEVGDKILKIELIKTKN